MIRSHAGTGRRRGGALALGPAAVLVAAGPFVACGFFLSSARDLVRRGDHAAALTALQRAGAVLPALREDGAYFLQIGRLEATLRRATPAAEFFAAQQLAEDGFAEQSAAAMLALLPALEPGTAGQREVVKRLLARAIAELNSGQTNPAMALLETILAVDPGNLRANYVLQIACLRAGRVAELRELAARMKETYRFLNTPTKRSVLAAAQEHLAAAELHAGPSATALTHWRYAKRLPK